MKNNPNLSYDNKSVSSIVRHARKLLGKSLRDLYPECNQKNAGKGSLGQLVEKIHFGYDPNSRSEADFKEAGLELKCTPLKVLSDGSMVSKERLVLNIIDYEKELDKTFETSSLMEKNALLLLMFYLHEKGINNLDLLFKIIRTWSIPEEDRKIFMDDWKIIHDKIITGHAHEISEGDTLYLAACPKGSRAHANQRKQPMSDILADQRAYSIKSSYINAIIIDSFYDKEACNGLKISKRIKEKLQSAVPSLRQYAGEETFEQHLINKFARYYGQTISQIADECQFELSRSPKSMAYKFCRGVLGVTSSHIAEFEKAGVMLKTIRLEANGGLKEAMSFTQINFCELAKEKTWEESEWHNILTHRFFFVIFRKSESGNDAQAILERVMFWAMPVGDLDKSEEYWRDTRDKVRRGDYTHFIKSTEHPISHVRPKAKNSDDKMLTPQGTMEKKKCYWLNRKYVLDKIVNA